MIGLLYLLFFLSGAAALVYQVAWVRSLSLVFGGSHLAVATVLSIFMGGLALGGAVFGRRVERHPSPLRLYAVLEIGIALSAAAFAGMMALYPALYVPAARLVGESPALLTGLRVLLAAAGMIVPTVLMGGTLPVLTRFVAGAEGGLARRLSFLYGLNTLGAVVGAVAAGFVFLPRLGLTRTLSVAIAANVLIGLAALLVRAPSRAAETTPDGAFAEPLPPRLRRAVLFAIAASGFCALGYEVLWTRMLGLVVGTSVYGFTIMLVAFLSGIGAGSAAYGIAQRRARGRSGEPRRLVLALGLVEIGIGLSALAVTYLLHDLPNLAIGVQSRLAGLGGSEFMVRQVSSLGVAFLVMFVPATLLGVAFPLAGTIEATGSRGIGTGVGRILAWNTVGAILGAAASGFVLVQAFGIERALQILVAANLGVGLWLAASVLPSAIPRRLAAAGTLAGVVFLGANPGWGRVWDERLFAIFRNNQRSAFDTDERVADALENTEVLFYREGANETISVIEPKGAARAVIVNGKTVASSMPQDRQCQYTLGHLPMLLHPDPRHVFVLGMGTGMTLGAVSVHPEVETLVLAEIEPSVVDAARLFSEFNHAVADDPRLRVVANDGRNFLLTTEERFDVITADPIHPWTRGSAYLYTTEYYETARSRLAPGGIMCQWLPIYELTERDLATVVRTFSASFRHVMLWLTFWDAELVGSDEPIRIDPEALARRIAHPPVASDLAAVEMGTVADFLSFFVAGTEGLRRFAAGGIVNTDDNLYLEFAAPASVGIPGLMGRNVAALGAAREPLSRYLSGDTAGLDVPGLDRAGRAYDAAHALWLVGEGGSPAFERAFGRVRDEFPGYAPGRFLEARVEEERSRTPRLLDEVELAVLLPDGRTSSFVLSAVTMKIGDERGAVVFVDSEAREIFAQRYVDAPAEALDARLREVGLGGLAAARAAHAEERGGALPRIGRFRARLREVLSDENR